MRSFSRNRPRCLAAVLCSALGAALAVAPAAALAEEPLQPHRAVYDIRLGEVGPSASVVAAEGRLVYDVEGASCEGYAVSSRFVTRVSDPEGGQRITDLRSASFETLQPATFNFANQTVLDSGEPTEVKGNAEGRANGVAVEITKPKTDSHELGRAIFPTAHTLLILQAAQDGERILEAAVFDGGDDADTLYDTTTVIGPVKTGLAEATPDELRALSTIDGAREMDVWRFVISFYAVNEDKGERMPDYELSFMMLENGVAYDVTFDYGGFQLTGVLRELELGDTPDC